MWSNHTNCDMFCIGIQFTQTKHRLTPCDGLCLGFEKYSFSKASSGETPDFLCFFFFLGWGGRPSEPSEGFNFTRWVLFCTSLAERRDSKEDKLIESCIETEEQWPKTNNLIAMMKCVSQAPRQIHLWVCPSSGIT